MATLHIGENGHSLNLPLMTEHVAACSQTIFVDFESQNNFNPLLASALQHSLMARSWLTHNNNRDNCSPAAVFSYLFWICHEHTTEE